LIVIYSYVVWNCFICSNWKRKDSLDQHMVLFSKNAHIQLFSIQKEVIGHLFSGDLLTSQCSGVTN